MPRCRCATLAQILILVLVVRYGLPAGDESEDVAVHEADGQADQLLHNYKGLALAGSEAPAYRVFR